MSCDRARMVANRRLAVWVLVAAAVVVGVVFGVKAFRFLPPSLDQAYLFAGLMSVSGLALILSARFSRAATSLANRRRSAAIGIGQILIGCGELVFNEFSALIFQGLVLAGMMLALLRVPRRVFADPASSP